MSFEMRIGTTVLCTFVVAASACYGTVSEQEQTEALGEQAALVLKKRDWLLNYDRHCGACFDAFSLCEKGAADLPDAVNCKAALDACVRGGLINDTAGNANAPDESDQIGEDAGTVIDVDPADADAGIDVDAALEEDAEARLGQPADAEADADVASDDDEDAGETDGSVGTCEASPFGSAVGRRRGASSVNESDVVCAQQDADADAGENVDVDGDVDAGSSEDPDVETQEPSPDAEGESATDSADPRATAESPLEASVLECLAATELCLDASSATADCVDGLSNCVRVALDQTFDEVCDVQIQACHAEGAAEQTTRAVETLCGEGLTFNQEPT